MRSVALIADYLIGKEHPLFRKILEMKDSKACIAFISLLAKQDDPKRIERLIDLPLALLGEDFILPEIEDFHYLLIQVVRALVDLDLLGAIPQILEGAYTAQESVERLNLLNAIADFAPKEILSKGGDYEVVRKKFCLQLDLARYQFCQNGIAPAVKES